LKVRKYGWWEGQFGIIFSNVNPSILILLLLAMHFALPGGLPMRWVVNTTPLMRNGERGEC